jgi:hypothetical protein
VVLKIFLEEKERMGETGSISPGKLLGGLKGVYLSGQAGDFPSRGAPMQGTLAGYPGDYGCRLLQSSLRSFQILLGYGLAHVPHHVFNPGFFRLVASPTLFVLPGPFHGGKMSGQIKSSEL